MTGGWIRLCVLLCLAVLLSAEDQPHIAENAPQDKPQDVTQKQVAAFEAAIKPFIEQARKSYPAAKARFLQGLPAGESFFVTTRIYDQKKNYEQVFVWVQRIEDSMIHGRLYSELRVVEGYVFKQPLQVDEDSVLDWLITKPDGTEEGNVVGKFLDTYEPE